MTRLGYWLSSEEHPPNDLVAYARQAESVGFSLALISDHYHPWLEEQGQAPFVWSVLGAIALATERLQLGTGVTCPTIRLHPAIVAQAAATTAAMMPGRFFLGVGTGENLNEHVIGEGWPPIEQRQAMLEEAIALMRRLWQGESVTFYGDTYTVEDARLFDLPSEPLRLYVAATGSGSAEIAARLGDGLISVGPNAEVVEAFRQAGSADAPTIGKLVVCYAADKDAARATAYRYWRNVALPGALMPALPTVSHFEQAVEMVDGEEVAQRVVLGPDPEEHRAAIEKLADAGFEQVVVHQIGPDQRAFFDFYSREILPSF